MAAPAKTIKSLKTLVSATGSAKSDKIINDSITTINELIDTISILKNTIADHKTTITELKAQLKQANKRSK